MTEFGEPAVGDLVVVAGKVQTSTYASADEAEPHQEILANRVWVIDDPTVVHDQPVETSDLVDALEDAHQGTNQETGPAVEEEPGPTLRTRAATGSTLRMSTLSTTSVTILLPLVHRRGCWLW